MGRLAGNSIPNIVWIEMKADHKDPLGNRASENAGDGDQGRGKGVREGGEREGGSITSNAFRRAGITDEAGGGEGGGGNPSSVGRLRSRELSRCSWYLWSRSLCTGPTSKPTLVEAI
ncbi:hypothetical protein G5I_10323 [Acromyrmex echinatior]|uniref:Uncharacterized protein n=1 Tax=Acromyrmex echinatior TaxID=103372 RepID=F4WWK9_ACREC|nr:hypothetical protein G5I_10323 [Acromyrmex echinatior]